MSHGGPRFLSKAILQKLLEQTGHSKRQFLLVPRTWKEFFNGQIPLLVQGKRDFWTGDLLSDPGLYPLYPFGGFLKEWFKRHSQVELKPKNLKKLEAHKAILGFLKDNHSRRSEDWFFNPVFLRGEIENYLDIWFQYWKMANKTPLVIFLDNLEYAENMLLRFLLRIVEKGANLPLLFVGFYGPRSKDTQSPFLMKLFQEAGKKGLLFEQDPRNLSEKRGNLRITPPVGDRELQLRGLKNRMALAEFDGAFRLLSDIRPEFEESPENQDMIQELDFLKVRSLLGQEKYSEVHQQVKEWLLMDPMEARYWFGHLFLVDGYFYSGKKTEAKKILQVLEPLSRRDDTRRVEYLCRFFQVLGSDTKNRENSNFSTLYPEFLELCQKLGQNYRRLSIGVSLYINQLIVENLGPEICLENLEDNIKLARKLRHTHFTARALDRKGHILTRLGRMDEAASYFNKAVRQISRTKDKQEKILILNGTGFFHLSHGNLAVAFKDFFKAIELLSGRLSNPDSLQKDSMVLTHFLTEVVLTILNLTYVCLFSFHFAMAERTIRVAHRLIESFGMKDIPFHSFLEIYLLLAFALMLQGKDTELVFLEDQIAGLSMNVREIDRFRLRFFEVFRTPELWETLGEYLKEEARSHPLEMERILFLLLMTQAPGISAESKGKIGALFQEEIKTMKGAALQNDWRKAYQENDLTPILRLPDMDQAIFSVISSSMQQLKAIFRLDRKIQEIELINQYQKTIYSLKNDEDLAQNTERFILLNIPCSLVHVVFSSKQEIPGTISQLPGLQGSLADRINPDNSSFFYDEFLWDQQIYASLVSVPVMLRQNFLGLIVVLDFSHEEHTRLDNTYFPLISLVAKQISLAYELIEHKKNLERGNREIEAEKQKGEETYRKLRSVQSQLIQSEKMSFLGSLVNGVAQEIQSPLAAIQSLADALNNNIPPMLDSLSNPPEDWEETWGLWEQLISKGNLGSRKSPKELRIRRMAIIEELSREEKSIDPERVERWVRFGLDEDKKLLELTDDSTNRKLDFLEAFAEMEILSDRLEDAVEQVKDTVESLKRFSYLSRSENGEWFMVDQGVETVLSIFRHFFRAGVRVNREINTSHPVFGSPDQLMQVWASLIYTRLEAMSFRGRLTIMAKEDEEKIQVDIYDDGPIWSSETAEKIFDPLQFLESEGAKATGLHLAKKILGAFQGELKLVGQMGMTGFQVVFPKLRPEDVNQGPYTY